MSPRTARAALLGAIVAAGAVGCSESVEPLHLAGPAVSFTMASGDAQAGAVGTALPLPLTVVTRDSAGQPVPGYAVQWSTTAGRVSTTSDTTRSDGTSKVSLELPATPDTVAVTASLDGFVPVTFHVYATAALTMIRGDSQTGAMGQTLRDSLTVLVADSAGQPLAGYAVHWVTSNGRVSSAQSTTGGDGLASVALTLPTEPDTLTVTASADGFTPLVFTEVAAASMQPAQGDTQVGAVGATLPVPLAVTIVDGAGHPVSGYRVHWTVTSGSVSAAETSTDTAGAAAVTLTLPTLPVVVTVTASASAMAPVSFTAAATPTGAPLVFRYVEVGSYHACGITTEEQSICWGFNEDGQVGAGELSSIEPLTRVTTGRTVRMTSGGRYHTCEVTLSGDVWCAGSNSTGQVTGSASSPVTQFTNVNWPIATSFRVVQAGLLHSCALSLSGQVWCWGSNGEGQIGIDSTIVPGSVVAPGAGYVGDNYTAVTSSGLHTCAVRTSGQAACWGWGASGQLGNGADTSTGVPVMVSGGQTFRVNPTVPTAPDPDFYIPGQSFISAGYAHTCGILNSNAAMCWGENEDGQLGNGGTGDADVPTAVSGGLLFRAISSGYRHTCGITTAGAAFCWGDNSLGQLGDGTTTRRLTPRAVAGGLEFMSISAGETFTCGVTTDGAAYCWGDNKYGQLGQTGIAGSTEPVKLPFQ